MATASEEGRLLDRLACSGGVNVLVEGSSR